MPYRKPGTRAVDKIDTMIENYLDGWITFGCIPAPSEPSWSLPKPYAYIYKDGARYTAHNYALRQAVGEPPAGKTQAAHTCRMAYCCNPAHLSWKSPKENAADKHRDGTHQSGDKAGHRKLWADDVREMKRLYDEGGWTHATLAERYGVVRQTVTAALNGDNWPEL